jgi:serpin B
MTANRCTAGTRAVLALTLAACSGTPKGAPDTALPDGGEALTQASSALTRDPASGISSGTLQGAVTANNSFAIDLYSHVLAERTNQSATNILTAPISASLALTMTYAGAVGQTASEMAAALHFGNAQATILDAQNALSQALATRAADGRKS